MNCNGYIQSKYIFAMGRCVMLLFIDSCRSVKKREKNGGKTVDPIFIFQSILEHQPRNRNQIFVSRARKVSDGADTPVKFYRISNLRETSKGEDFKLRGNEKRSWRHLAANSAARGGNFRIFVYDCISPTDFFADGKR